MTDITMCTGGYCPLKEKCYRYKANPDEYQWYIDPPYADGKCEEFWELDPDNSLNIRILDGE